ncbi:DUF2306 domain-containing protein [Sphingomonas sp. BK580]|uniref:DUF2306 domain-containing protein n=1 Tax=Sphingomonas sp. BK580 TaxID=2586972 RepID=UPI00183C3033|nr:DUF2306 domain-containing protein [Sphingomonas sp. BK580]MBB3695621.1 putative membrane protein [Sphingomonas sp. BK580]
MTAALLTSPARQNRQALSRIGWSLATFLSAGVALVSYRYLAHVGPVAPTIATNRFGPWIVVHVAGAATALLLATPQFSGVLRQRSPTTHRMIGRIYMVGCLVGGAGGLVLAAGSSAGLFAQAGFAAVGSLWIYTTLQGWATVRSRRFAEHRRWMFRSFVLTFAAVTLRIYLPILIALGFDFQGAYRIIAWLCWVPNLLLVEVYLRHSSATAAGDRRLASSDRAGSRKELGA